MVNPVFFFFQWLKLYKDERLEVAVEMIRDQDSKIKQLKVEKLSNEDYYLAKIDKLHEALEDVKLEREFLKEEVKGVSVKEYTISRRKKIRKKKQTKQSSKYFTNPSYLDYDDVDCYAAF